MDSLRGFLLTNQTNNHMKFLIKTTSKKLILSEQSLEIGELMQNRISKKLAIVIEVSNKKVLQLLDNTKIIERVRNEWKPITLWLLTEEGTFKEGDTIFRTFKPLGERTICTVTSKMLEEYKNEHGNTLDNYGYKVIACSNKKANLPLILDTLNLTEL